MRYASLATPPGGAGVLYDPHRLATAFLRNGGYDSLEALPSTTRVQRLAREQGLARLRTAQHGSIPDQQQQEQAAQ